MLRIYDAGPEVADRYTIVPPRSAHRIHKAGKLWECICCSESPFHPLGFGCWAEAAIGPHLGKRIAWSELPGDAQRYARQSFPQYAPKAED